MKKKKMLCVLLACLFSLRAFPYIVTTKCGEKVCTVSPSYFDSKEEWKAYLKDLDKIFCGDEKNSANTLNSDYDKR